MTRVTPPAPAALGPLVGIEVTVDCGRVRLETRHDGLRLVTRCDAAQANALGGQLLRASLELGLLPAKPDTKEA